MTENIIKLKELLDAFIKANDSHNILELNWLTRELYQLSEEMFSKSHSTIRVLPTSGVTNNRN